MKYLLSRLIKLYQYFLSPYLGNNCRFYPTCSNYALEALEKYGIIKGLKLSIIRILRCNPWGGNGIDLVSDRDAKNKN